MLGIFKALKEYREASGTDNLDAMIGKKKATSQTDPPVNSPAQQRAIAKRYYDEILNDANLDTIDELMAAEFLFTIPTHPDPYHGPQGFKDLVTMLHGAFPDVHLDVQHLLVEGETVVGHWIGSGTHTGGPLHTVKGDIPPSGKHFVIDGVSWLKIRDGKIIESLANEDTLSLLHQIGVIPMPPAAPDPIANRNTAKQFLEDLFNAGKFDDISTIVTPEFIMHWPLLPRPIRGIEGLKHFAETIRAGFPDLHYRIEHEMGDQGMAALRWWMKGTHQGEFMGFAPTQKVVEYQGVSIFQLEGGLIKEVWVNENALGLLEQLGAMGG